MSRFRIVMMLSLSTLAYWAYCEQDHLRPAPMAFELSLRTDDGNVEYMHSTRDVTREDVKRIIAQQGSLGMKTCRLLVGGAVPSDEVLYVLLLLREAGFETCELAIGKAGHSWDIMYMFSVSVKKIGSGPPLDESQEGELRRQRKEIQEMIKGRGET